MRLVGRQVVQKKIDASPQSVRARDLRAWLGIVENCKWLGPADVQADFPGASSNSSMWLFPLQPSGVSVKALVGFRADGQVVIKEVI